MSAIHGIALNVFNTGILIKGKSGVGKSELGLELIDRGHQLISDDLVNLTQEDNNIYITTASQHALGYIEIRGIGFINIAKLYGSQYVAQKQKLDLIIELVAHSELKNLEQNRLQQLISHKQIHNKNIIVYQLPTGANRNLAVLVELIVKYHTNKMNGYDSHQEFIKNHDNLLKEAE